MLQRARASAPRPPRGRWRCPRRAVVSFYDQTVENFAKKTARALPVRTAFELARNLNERSLLTSAQFLARELPVRLAWTLRDFQALPYIVGVNPHIMRLFVDYSDTFQALSAPELQRPITTLGDEVRWTTRVNALLRRNQNAISTLSAGIAEARMLPATASVYFEFLDRFIEQFIYQRLARRTMAAFHQALHQQFHQKEARKEWLGCFHLRCSPATVVRGCFDDVARLALGVYGRAPKLTIIGDTEATFTFYPILLENVLYELFKNSLRAVHEHHAPDASLPDVVVKICAGEEMTIIVSDRGGGVPPELLNDVWGYGFSTHTPSEFDVENYKVNFRSGEETDQTLQFAGWGFGLPMSRAFIQYFGGQVLLNSLPGYGTDVYIHMPPVDSAQMASRGVYTERRKPSWPGATTDSL